MESCKVVSIQPHSAARLAGEHQRVVERLGDLGPVAVAQLLDLMVALIEEHEARDRARELGNLRPMRRRCRP